MMMVIVRLLLGENHRLRGWQVVKANSPRLKTILFRVRFVRIPRASRRTRHHALHSTASQAPVARNILQDFVSTAPQGREHVRKAKRLAAYLNALQFFVGGDEAIVEGFEGGTVTACAEGGHVEDVTAGI